MRNMLRTPRSFLAVWLAYALANMLPVCAAEDSVSLRPKAEDSAPRSALRQLLGQSGAATANREKPPNLYVLAIGVSEYRQSELRLRFPAKDAQDIAALLRGQERSLYGAVTARVLTDKDATRDNILDGLEWLQRQPSPPDVVILFLSGHGITDPSTTDYYFLPYDADPQAIKRTMLAQTEFQNSLRHIRGKVLVFLDTCHAGKVFGTVQTRGLSSVDVFVAELKNAPSGIVVFTSSTSSQLSLESAEWGNGAFTRAVLEGLRGRADRDHSGRVTVNMLDLYVSQRVLFLTARRQSPSTAKLSTVPDFTITVVKQLLNEDVQPLR